MEYMKQENNLHLHAWLKVEGGFDVAKENQAPIVEERQITAHQKQ